MTYVEFHSRLEEADITLKEFAAIVRMNRTSISNYAKFGEVPSHLAIIATLMREIHTLGADFRGPLAKVKISPKKPRGAGKQGRFGGDRQRRFDASWTTQKVRRG